MMRTINQDVWDAKEFLRYCAQTHPKAQIVDYVKRLYHSEYGMGDQRQSAEESLKSLREGIAGLMPKQLEQPFFDPYCGVFCRMNLSISKLLRPETMNRILLASAREGVARGARVRLEEKLRLFVELCREENELFPFSAQEAADYVEEYRKAGCPPVSHSPEYREAYTPAYRVVRKDYSRYPELYAAMETCLREKGHVNVAIEGNCGSGKTAAAGLIASLFDGAVFHADDFFLPQEKRTPERLREIGGNMERERFREEVCEKVRTGKPFSYRVFDCSAMQMGETVEVSPKKVNIFEGCYCMHPDLREYYDIKVFLSITPQEQEARILERNGSFMLRRFLEEWIPMENRYFEEMKVREACDFIY